MNPVKRKSAKKKSVVVHIDANADDTVEELPENPSKRHQQRVHTHFSPLVGMFAVTAVAVGVLIFYIAFSKTVITVTVNPQLEDFVFSYPVDDVDAQVVSAELEDSFTYTDFTESTEETTGTATGTVTIYNNYSADQPLVRTTRLLSESGVLFRTDETVTVPAGESVEVAVYADQPGSEGDIKPTTFEIVALWDGLKDQIYAESTEAMTGGIVRTGTVTEEALEEAQKKAEQQLRRKAAEQLAEDSNVTNTIEADDVLITVTEQTTDPKAGEPANEITIDTEATATAYAFDKRKLVDLLTQETGSDVTDKKLQYEIIDKAGQAYIQGTVKIPKSATGLNDLDTSQLTSKSAEQIQSYLESFDEVSNVDTTFSPFWINTSSPSAKNIEVIVIQ